MRYTLSPFWWGEAGPTTYAEYPFASDLNSIAGGGVATLTRTTAKTVVYSDGTGVEDIGTGVAGFNNEGLTIDPLRQNKLLRSREFDNGAWPVVTGSVTANVANSPLIGEVSPSADRLTSNAGSGLIQQTAALGSGSRAMISVCAKAGTKDWICMQAIRNSFPSERARFWFDLTNGTTGTVSDAGGATLAVNSHIRDLGNGWYLCQGLFDYPTGNSFRATYFVAEADNSTSLTGAGDILLWQADMQVVDCFTSPVHTIGSTVTHNADILTIPCSGFPVNDFTMDIEYTFYGENESPMATPVYHQQSGADLGYYTYWSESTSDWIMTKYNGGAVTDTATIMDGSINAKIGDTFTIKNTLNSSTGFRLDVDAGNDTSATVTDVVIPVSANVGSKDGSTVACCVVKNLKVMDL